MSEHMNAIRTALRVLSSINGRRPPAGEDAEALRRYARQSKDMPTEDLACKVIHLAMRARAIDRCRRSSQN
jgi:hypothetical protein